MGIDLATDGYFLICYYYYPNTTFKPSQLILFLHEKPFHSAKYEQIPKEEASNSNHVNEYIYNHKSQLLIRTLFPLNMQLVIWHREFLFSIHYYSEANFFQYMHSKGHIHFVEVSV